MPAINLRDVPEELVRAFKVRAAGEGLGLRDWILKTLEGGDETRRDGLHLRGGTDDGGAVRQRSKRNGSLGKAVSGAHDAPGSPAKSGAVGDGSRKDSRGEGPGKKCTEHGKVMRDFGNSWLCEGPPLHKEFK